ncbi:MAG TPA: N-6 DNA methylase [Candidatus Desulfaltia sp.]|nr:N-6 DNA methylase [Candidatus Desulfaltia sp.]
MSNSSANKFCKSADLTNEASVESFFVLRLLADLGYKDSEIKTKQAIQTLRIPKGRSKELYKPDFLLFCHKKPRWLIEAKSPTERIEQYTYQCAGYALQINRKYLERPLHYYMLTNGFLTRVYVWDQEEAILSLRFEDVNDHNSKYETFRRLFSADVARSGWKTTPKIMTEGHELSRPTMDAVKKAFLRCHRIIWKTEKMSPQAAFMEFAKILFVKLWEDRRLRDDPNLLEMITRGNPLPSNKVRFATRWIREQESNNANPIDALLFRQLVESLEQEIESRQRKRIFESDEKLNISPGTVRRVVKELENYYLFGIDEDLNGRMFEAFLAATMRGKELGQYFTPRSIVKLMTKLANLKAQRGPNGIEKLIDACCGTGGFLIEALTEMRRQVYDNQSLSSSERSELLEKVANQAIFGIDAGRSPMIARIARINMYLHGDGGSRVYMTDALKHPPEASLADTIEVRGEVEELRSLLEKETKFDAALTNPPFSMDYSSSIPEEKDMLDTYELTTYGGKRRNSLRSSVIFIERYWNLLRPGGRLLTVIDDSVLAGKNFPFVRDFIRERFIIRAVISLHGDAFRRAGARAKTSILYLVKKRNQPEIQQGCFVYESQYIGRDDVPPKTRPSDAEHARKLAADETEEITTTFNSFLQGRNGPWLVPPDKLNGRLDAKHLRPWSVSELENKWTIAGADSDIIENLLDLIEESVDLDPNTRYTFLRISYEGRPERGDAVLGKEVSYKKVFRAKKGDIIISNINAVNKAICVMPNDMSDLLISPAFTVLRLKPSLRDRVDQMYIWSVLRTPAVVAEWLSHTTGFGRHYVDWNHIRKQRIPLLPPDKQQHIGSMLRELFQHEQEISIKRAAAADQLAILGLDDDRAKDRLIRAKPPR